MNRETDLHSEPRGIADVSQVPRLAYQFMDLTFQEVFNGQLTTQDLLKERAETVPELSDPMFVSQKRVEDNARLCELATMRVIVSQNATLMAQNVSIIDGLAEVSIFLRQLIGENSAANPTIPPTGSPE